MLSVSIASANPRVSGSVMVNDVGVFTASDSPSVSDRLSSFDASTAIASANPRVSGSVMVNDASVPQQQRPPRLH